MMNLKKNTPTFLFYDYETFGTNTALDKVAQFACIRTDIDLNIINDPQCFYCFPPDDYLPDPNATLITNITPQYTQKYGTNEYNFSKKINDIFTISNTCIVGFNNINFDDEITRNIFYRNFFDPYEWSWKNGNSRWDILNLIRACYALRPDGIKWPKNELGLTSFKLSDLTLINNINHINAHDAISDVYATVEIAKLIKKKQPKLFNFFLRNRNKYELFQLINLKKFTPIVYISSVFGTIRYNMTCVLPITWHKFNKNILICIDLFHDIKKLILFCEKISYNNTCIQDLFHLGVVLLQLNRCPMLAPIQVIRDEDFNRLKLNMNSYNKKIISLKDKEKLIKKIQIIFSQKKYLKESKNVDLQIYHSFFDCDDKKTIKIIRSTNPNLLKKNDYEFHDTRLKILFFRYRARNFFNLLNNCEKRKWLKHCFEIINPLSLKEYKKNIKRLLEQNSYNTEKVVLLNTLVKYIYQKYNYLLNEHKKLN